MSGYAPPRRGDAEPLPRGGVATFAGGLAWSAFDIYALGLVATALLAGCLYPVRLGSLPAGE